MANLLADAQLTLRAAGRGTFFLVVAGHGRKSPRRARVWDTSIVICPVETNEAWMAGKNPAIALPQFQLKKIQALR
ncbi:hypothetical protein QA649_00250 [Bradyrhizobium sp. CB1717]|uniref:hypothetical protein n=1 Tax=Bradyrhizobium sp. CB1717 TaxID=3039154 RepID=UPI0024B0CAFA|nr:hypothetical protein [Bradyrhizobium sp. CB1717]WFU29123.1 hypothetical protein QA649_00250 [Bradyrhizobium sp. CB1717]